MIAVEKQLTAPCRGCEKRAMGCHARCPDYIAFSERQRARSEQTIREGDVANYVTGSILRQQRRAGRK